MGICEERLKSFGYLRLRGKNWKKGNSIVQVQNSKGFNRDYMSISWREEWKNFHVLLFDYSPANGPICIVPAKTFFNSTFVEKKRKMPSYAKCKLCWHQDFPRNHKVAILVLKYENRWEIFDKPLVQLRKPTESVIVSTEKVEKQLDIIIDGSNVAYDLSLIHI